MSNRATDPDLFDCGWYISYMRYYATGEGATFCVAVGGSQKYAEEVLKERIGEYFHQGIETVPVNREMSEHARMMLARVPDPVKDALRKIPLSAGYYFSEFHFNLA
jgi:hypothetical protein